MYKLTKVNKAIFQIRILEILLVYSVTRDDADHNYNELNFIPRA